MALIRSTVGARDCSQILHVFPLGGEGDPRGDRRTHHEKREEDRHEHEDAADDRLGGIEAE